MELKEKIKNFRDGVNDPGMVGHLKARFMASAETILRDSGHPPLASVLGLSPANIEVTVNLRMTDAEIISFFSSFEAEEGESKISFTFSAKLILRILGEDVEFEFNDLIPLAEVGGVKSRRFWQSKSELQSVVGELSRLSGTTERGSVIVNAVHDGRLRKGDFAVQLMVEMYDPVKSGSG